MIALRQQQSSSYHTGTFPECCFFRWLDSCCCCCFCCSSPLLLQLLLLLWHCQLYCIQFWAISREVLWMFLVCVGCFRYFARLLFDNRSYRVPRTFQIVLNTGLWLFTLISSAYRNSIRVSIHSICCSLCIAKAKSSKLDWFQKYFWPIVKHPVNRVCLYT